MEFGGDMIKFNISDSIKNPNDVRSCFAIDVIKNLGQERSAAPIKKDVSRTTIEEEIGVEHKEHATTLKIPNLADSTPSEFVDSAATFEPLSQYIGEPIGCYLLWFRCPIETKMVREFTLTLGSSTPQSGRITIPFCS
ncbi:hypothetical protein PS2_012942 [Malus domestica]